MLGYRRWGRLVKGYGVVLSYSYINMEQSVTKGRTASAHNSFNPKFIENNTVRLCVLSISVISRFQDFIQEASIVQLWPLK